MPVTHTPAALTHAKHASSTHTSSTHTMHARQPHARRHTSSQQHTTTRDTSAAFCTHRYRQIIRTVGLLPSRRRQHLTPIEAFDRPPLAQTEALRGLHRVGDDATPGCATFGPALASEVCLRLLPPLPLLLWLLLLLQLLLLLALQAVLLPSEGGKPCAWYPPRWP